VFLGDQWLVLGVAVPVTFEEKQFFWNRNEKLPTKPQKTANTAEQERKITANTFWDNFVHKVRAGLSCGGGQAKVDEEKGTNDQLKGNQAHHDCTSQYTQTNTCS
jgi:hypothetical protein